MVERAAPVTGAYVDWYAGERLQRWATPPEFFQKLHQEFRFTLDGAAEADNALLPRFHDEPLWDPQAWEGERVFCNPPWSNIPPFVELAAGADVAVLLVPARTNCRWFHRALDLGADVRYFKPKLKFVGAPHVSPVDCVLLVWGASNTGEKP